MTNEIRTRHLIVTLPNTSAEEVDELAAILENIVNHKVLATDPDRNATVTSALGESILAGGGTGYKILGNATSDDIVLVDTDDSEAVIIPDAELIALAGALLTLSSNDEGGHWSEIRTNLPEDLDDADALVVLPNDYADIPGAQTDDGIVAIALIDLARYIVANYEDDTEPELTPVWTITENHDGDVTVSTFGTEHAATGAIWADVKEAADNDGIDIEADGLGTDEFGDPLDVTEVNDWCRFIEEHGWKCREYTLTQSTIDPSTEG